LPYGILNSDFDVSFVSLMNFQKDVEVNAVFKQFTCQLRNKEYLTAAVRLFPLSCKQLISGHVVEYRMTP